MDRLASLVIAGVSFVVLSLAPGNVWGQGIAVIVHPATPVDSMSLSELRHFFMGDWLFWSSRVRVTILNPAPNSPERTALLKTVFEMSESQFSQYWIGKVFQGDLSGSPKTVSSSEMAMALVEKIPGAIAIVSASRIPEGVKVLKINGRLPSEPGYPFP